MGDYLWAHARGATATRAPPPATTFTLSTALAADFYLLGLLAPKAATENSDIFMCNPAFVI